MSKQTVTDFLNEKSAVYSQCVKSKNGSGARQQIKEVLFKMAAWDQKQSKELCSWLNKNKVPLSKEIRCVLKSL